MTDISNTIRELRDSYDCSPYDINDGRCEEFMQDVTARVAGAEECCTGFVLDNRGLAYPVHVWVFYDGRHYDAECPQGVDSFLDLPFFETHDLASELDSHDLHDNKFTREAIQ